MKLYRTDFNPLIYDFVRNIWISDDKNHKPSNFSVII